MTAVQSATREHLAGRPLREEVRVMALGLGDSLINQLLIVTGDLKRSGFSDHYVHSALRSLIEEIRKERRR